MGNRAPEQRYEPRPGPLFRGVGFGSKSLPRPGEHGLAKIMTQPVLVDGPTGQPCVRPCACVAAVDVTPLHLFFFRISTNLLSLCNHTLYKKPYS